MPRQKPAAKPESPSEQQYKSLINQHNLITRSSMPRLERLPKLRRAFLRAFAETLSIAKSAKRIGRDPDTHHYWRQTDKCQGRSKSFPPRRRKRGPLVSSQAVSP